MTTPETQAYLNHNKAPTVSSAQVRAALRSFLAGVGNYQAEIATQIRLLNDALMVELDPAVWQKLFSEQQVLGALRREVSEVEAQVRDIAPVLTQRDQSDTAFRAIAGSLGYTV